MMDDLRWMRRCPRFKGCSVNACPLDPLVGLRLTRSFDPRRTCRESLRTRLAVVNEARLAGVKMEGGGLTAAEVKSGKTVEILLAEWDEKVQRKRLQCLRLLSGRRC